MIYIIEDNKEIAELTMEILHERLHTTGTEISLDGFAVFHSADNFLTRANIQPSDIFIIDVDLQDSKLNGAELSFYLINDKKVDPDRVIIASGVCDTKATDLLRDLGVDKFLAKPISYRTLLSFVSSVYYTKPRT